MNKINLGGGNTKIDGYTNIDILALPNVDIVYDLSKGIPLEDNSVDEIYTAHFLEHLDDTVGMMTEIYRVCRANALVRIKVPYFKSVGAFKDPTHKSFFTEKTFDYFNKTIANGETLPDYLLDVDFRLEKTAYIWSAPWLRFLPGKKSVLFEAFLEHCSFNVC